MTTTTTELTLVPGVPAHSTVPACLFGGCRRCATCGRVHHGEGVECFRDALVTAGIRPEADRPARICAIEDPGLPVCGEPAVGTVALVLDGKLVDESPACDGHCTGASLEATEDLRVTRW